MSAEEGPLGEVVAAAAPLLGAEQMQEAPEGEFASVADPDRAITLEAVREGYLMHYAAPRAIPVRDQGLALLGGDTLYALGLARLAEHGDLEAIAELADLISLCASAQAAGDPALAEELWRASAGALAGEGAGARAAFQAGGS